MKAINCNTARKYHFLNFIFKKSFKYFVVSKKKKTLNIILTDKFFLRFYIYMRSNNICLSLSDLFHLA